MPVKNIFFKLNFFHIILFMEKYHEIDRKNYSEMLINKNFIPTIPSKV